MVFPNADNVAVYGTLKHGENNHRLLSGCRLLGTDRIRNLALYHLGNYPGAVREPDAETEVEVYRVTRALLKRLDELEDFHLARRRQSLYLRKRVRTRFGPTWLYLYNRPVYRKQRLNGPWKGTGHKRRTGQDGH